MELDVDALPPAGVPVGPRISTFPPVLFDLALPSTRPLPAAEFEAALRRRPASCWSRCGSSTSTPGPLVPEGTKSLAYSLTLRAPDRTLSGEEAAAVRGRRRRGARARGAELRG